MDNRVVIRPWVTTGDADDEKAGPKREEGLAAKNGGDSFVGLSSVLV